MTRYVIKVPLQVEIDVTEDFPKWGARGASGGFLHRYGPGELFSSFSDWLGMAIEPLSSGESAKIPDTRLVEESHRPRVQKVSWSGQAEVYRIKDDDALEPVIDAWPTEDRSPRV